MNIKELIVRYGVVARRRFYSKEKLRFLRGAVQEFEDAGMGTVVKEAESLQRKAYNLYVGDLVKSNLIISTYYDTPPKTFGLIKHKVFHPENDRLSFIISILVPILFLALIFALLIKPLFAPVFSDGVIGYKDVLAMIPALIIVFFIIHFKNGIGNTSNFKRNTSSIITCIYFIQTIQKKMRNNVGIVFTDFGCINHFGDEMLCSELKENASKKTVILLDCLGGSDEVNIIYRRSVSATIDKVRAFAENKKINFKEISNDDKRFYSIFEKSIIITSGKFSGDDVFIGKVNTLRDNDINEDGIILVTELLKEFVR